MEPSTDIRRLIEIMAALRTPGSGCPWDLEQTHASLAPYALEEAYEVVDAIERQNAEDLRDELGDLLIQVVFHARIAEETGTFNFGDVVEGVTSKMLRRHPHVFASKKKGGLSGVDIVWEAMRARQKRPAENGTADEGPLHGLLAAMDANAEAKPTLSNKVWETIKAQERRAKPKAADGESLLASVTLALPGLSRAVKLQDRAAEVGFDWNEAKLVLAKIREEIDEIGAAIEADRREAVAEEVGDLLFAVANLARHTKVDPEAAIRATNRKFERRFAYIEKQLAGRDSSVDRSNLAEMDALWNAAKAAGL